MQRHGQRRWIGVLVRAVVVGTALVLVLTGPAATQVDTEGSIELPAEGGDQAEATEGEAQGRISDTENENRIDRAVLALLIIAFSLAVLTMLFWWHTQPQRRARALARRREASVDDPVPPTPADDPAPEAISEPAVPSQRPVPQGAEHG